MSMFPLGQLCLPAENLVAQVPGARSVKRQKIEIWSFLLTPDLLEIVLENTNKYIQLKQYNPIYKTARKPM